MSQKGEPMKVGEFYYNRFNHYASKVISVSTDIVMLKNEQDVTDVVKIERFNMNWKPIHVVAELYDYIIESFPKSKIKCVQTYSPMGIIIVGTKEKQVTFSVFDNSIQIRHTDNVLQDVPDLFLIDDAEDVIDIIASLFYD